MDLSSWLQQVKVKTQGSREKLGGASRDPERMKYWPAFEAMREYEVSRVFVSPEMAAGMLEHSTFQNRKINQKNLKKLKRDIVTGRYQVTHQGVAMTREQAVIDGQHRLLACKETGICIPLYLFSNLPEDVVWSVDRGSLRTVDQDLFMHGEKWSKKRVELLRMCVELLGYDSTNIRDKREYDSWMPLFEQGIGFALPLSSRTKGTARTAPVLGSFAFAHPVNPVAIAGYAEMFVTGVQIPTEDDPMNRLRRHVEDPKNRNRGQRPRAMLGRAATWALHKSLDGYKVKQVRRDMSGVRFFRQFYEHQFPDIIKTNTPDRAKRNIDSYGAGKPEGKKRIDDYEE